MKEGGIIKDGYNAEVDKLRNAKSDGKDWLAKLETDEREKDRNQESAYQIQQSIWLLSGSYQFF